MFSFYLQTPGRLPGRGRPRGPGHHRRMGRQPGLRPRSAPGVTNRSAAVTADDADADVDVAIVGRRPVGAGARRPARRSAAVRSWCSSSGPSPTRSRGRCTSTTRWGASSSPAGIGDEVRALSEPAEVYEWRNGQGTTLLRFGRVGVGPVRLALLVDVLPARARGLPPAAGRRRCRRSRSGAACGSTASRRTVTRSRSCTPRGRIAPGTSWAATAPTPPSATCSGSAATTGASSTTGSSSTSSSTSRGSSIRSTSRSATRPVRRPPCPGGPGRRRWEFMRLPDERVEDLNQRGPGLGAARAVGRAPGQRPPRTARRLHVPGPRRGAVAGRARLPRRRRRAPDAALRRTGHVLRAP